MLAGAYLFCGFGISYVVRELQTIFSGFGIDLPIITRVLLDVGPVGWSCAALAAGFLVILKDLRFRSRLLNPLFTMLLVSGIAGMALALFSALRNMMIIH